ncbi:P-loop containing nucleoside triphosphate hydrolase protein [Dactylonectria macrodidyma]|uniref:P-loop containing nucleoside triphosphate hydrolase protein n=1 Tax=Dactylonectria macrodidyma TaxID=307937 RepID=A0A9P9JKR7_9HYPO|nr:P-loop containing nucleoside triphosphate hydrolase protein [Dactylonectria macrodidyma]
MSRALLVDSRLLRDQAQQAHAGYLGPIFTLVAIIAISFGAIWRLWHQPRRRTVYLVSTTQVLINVANTACILVCIVTSTFQLVQKLELENIVSGLAWILCLFCRIGYFAFLQHRGGLHHLANCIALSVLAFIAIPAHVYPIVVVQGIQGNATLSLIQTVYLAGVMGTSVIFPLITPAHNRMEQHEAPLHPSTTCSPIVRWWTYGWISPFVASAYANHGDVSFINIPVLTPKSSPSAWASRLRDTRLETGSTARAVWVLFKPRLVIMATFMVLCGFAEFIGAVGLRSLLQYLEGSSSKGAFQPWFAAILFGASPVIRGLCMQTFESFSTEAICHFKSMVTSTIYDKLLKQRPGVRSDSGQITNHVAADLDKIAVLRYSVMAGFMVPVEVAVASVLLYQTMGWSYVPGLVIILVTRIPISWYVSQYQGHAQSAVMAAIDARVRRVSEVVKGLQTVQMLGQAMAFRAWIDEKREKELLAIWAKMKIVVASDTLSAGFVLVPLVVSLGLYTMFAGLPLTPTVVFTVVSIFNTIKNMMSLAVIGVSTYAHAMVSLKRVLAFLDNELSQSGDGEIKTIENGYTDEEVDETSSVFGALNATLQVYGNDGTTRTVLKNVSFDLIRGGLNVITGKTGSGKSTLLKGLFSEAHVSQGELSARAQPFETVSYAGQSPWLQQGTIRENILFGSPYSERRYQDTIKSTGLEVDLKNLPEGDATIVGERGSSLSGGQRARVAMARAIFADTQTVLLDDVLSALDATTSRVVVDKCILGDLMNGRTIVLVTEDDRCCQSADLLLELQDGAVTRMSRDEEALKPSKVSSVTISETEASDDTFDTLLGVSEFPEPCPPSTDKPHPINSEKLITGLIGRVYILKYMRLFGSPAFLCLFCCLALSSQGADVLLSFWLTIWSGKYEHESSQQERQKSLSYLMVYTGIGALQISLVCMSSLIFFYGALRASRTEHSRMIASVLGATFTWVTTTPGGWILNRFSSDMFSLDNTITELLKQVLENFLAIGFRLAAVSSALPSFILPAVALLGLGMYIGQVYLHGSTAAKRLYAAGLSPIIIGLTDVISGIEVIRAHRVETTFRDQFLQSLEHYLQGWEAVSATQRWLAVRMDFMAGLISLLTATLALSSQNTSPAVIGFSMTSSTTLCTALLYIVYLSSVLQVEMNCFQRIEEYIHTIPQEQSVLDNQVMSNNLIGWPQNGNVEIKHVTAGYTIDGDAVLSNINLEAKPGQRIAIVGRSGSGKSSLAATLLRLTQKFQGCIVIDGVDIDTVEVDELRRRICFIPQNPTLFTGSLRFNLDFSGTISEQVLQKVLKDVLGDLSATKHWHLDKQIEADGANLSQGERQLISMARALVTDARVVLIDEATANLDAESEKRVQRLLKERFSHKTLIAIAHRLASVAQFDWVYVMDQGNIVEQGDPRHLMAQEGGEFWKLWQATRD